MCTSFTFSAPNQHFLSRTMDFSFILDAQPVFIPRGYKWTSFNQETQVSRYAFVGSGRKLDEYLVADGMNEKGLAAAELYYPNFASYPDKPAVGKKNIAPHQFIMWLLGENATVQEVRKQVVDLCLVNSPVPLLGLTVPLHFIVTDATGETITIETENNQLTVKENPIGVMANSPNLEWHLQNLNSYVGVQPTNLPTQKMGELTLQAFGQGSGTLPLPGSYVSTDRFIRAAFLKQYLVTSEKPTETVGNIFHVLDSVNVPKGIDLKDNGDIDFTQYKAALDTVNLTYYFMLYENNALYTVQLNEELVTHSEPIAFSVEKQMTVHALTLDDECK